MNNITVVSHVGEVKDQFEKALETALEKAGMKCESHAKMYCKPHGPSTGDLRDTIYHDVVKEEEAVYIGSDLDYSIYFELGTGKYYPGGRPTAWVYQDAKGEWHRTEGQPPKPFLKPALERHADEYRKIFEKVLGK